LAKLPVSAPNCKLYNGFVFYKCEGFVVAAVMLGFCFSMFLTLI